MQYISDFCDYIQYQKRYSKHTVNAYDKDLEQFYNYCFHQFETSHPKEIQSSFIRSWIVYLIEKQITSRTINRKISTLKSFYKYLLKNKVVEQNPTLKIISPKNSKKLPTFITETEINNLLDNIDFEKGFEGARNKLIITLFYHTGIRLSELINLTKNSINHQNKTIKVLGKRNKERIIPISDKLLIEIKNYLNEFEHILKKEHYLFLTKKGKKIYPKLVYRIVNNYLSQVTSNSKKSPHVLRHTFATHILNNGAGLNSIKELLGHANLSATQVYTHNTIEKLKKIHNQAHPKA